MKTKLILSVSLLLAILMIVCSCGGETPNDNGENTGYSQNLAFELNEDGSGYYLSGRGGCKDAHVVIPDTYNGLPVTGLGEGCLFMTEDEVMMNGGQYIATTAVTIPSSVTYLAPYALAGCDIASIEIPGSVVSIGDYAFSQCWYLTDVKLSAGTETLGSYVFNECSELKNVTLSNTLKSIGEGAFSGLSKLNSVVLPTSLESIGARAFECCSSIAEVAIPDSVTSLGEYAFSTCTGLRTAAVGDGVTVLNGTFYCCDNLETIKLGESVKEITNYGISDYTSLKVLDISNVALWCSDEFNLEYLTNYHNISLYVNGENAETLEIPEGVISIRSYAFYGFKNIKFVTLPDTLHVIGNEAFRGCENLRRITLPRFVESIGTAAFRNCYRLVEVHTLSKINWGHSDWSASAIGEHALNVYADSDGEDGTFTIENGLEIFTYKKVNSTKRAVVGCESTATSLAIPDDVDAVIPYAFVNCTQLEVVKISSLVDTIGENIFVGCTSLSEISIPYFADAQTPSAAMRSFQHLGYLFGACGYDYTYQGEMIPESLKSVKFTCKTIPEGAFYGCNNIVTVAIPHATSIGNDAFYGCDSIKGLTVLNSSVMGNHFTVSALEELAIMEQTSISAGDFSDLTSLKALRLELTTQIGAGAFANCTSLTSLAIPYANSIGEGAFSGCDLTELTARTLMFELFNLQNLEKVVVSQPMNEGRTGILDCTFENCTKLKSVVIDDRIQVIGTAAFRNCTSLTEVVIGGDMIDIGISAFEGCTALESITIPYGVKKISYKAFCNCTSLKEVTLGRTVDKIVKNAFEGCTSLAVITFDDPSGWYRTQSENDFDYCTNGVPTDVNDPEYFTKDYIDYYWYKL